ncbi:deoxyribonuclease IV [Desulfovibrio inopinatus]|uniref:deoxyribonuclease IV n=1 Tax=Desulfovibrio inopinatus TaxID=102109 RepID=UPI000480A6A8|nr:deoxyribonuclease IV [Desulfovibrio inopinatus]
MLKIGCHLSSSKGFLAMGKTAVSIGANTFQFFTRNPRGGAAKPLDEDDIAAYLKFSEEHELQPILAHAPYTLNACAADEKKRAFTQETMADDLRRLEHIPGSMYNFHPGNHVGQGVETGIKFIAETLNAVVWPQQSSVVLLETMAGKGSEIGRTFEELRSIIDMVDENNCLGVCLDTCHIHDGGYDIAGNLEHVLETFEKRLGLHRLKAIHLNDSMNPLGSHKDRHEKIGRGSIGMEALTRIVNHPSLRTLPFYLETPNDMQGYKKEISLLKAIYQAE